MRFEVRNDEDEDSDIDSFFPKALHITPDKSELLSIILPPAIELLFIGIVELDNVFVDVVIDVKLPLSQRNSISLGL